jgi:CheY-like chemotaxis protein
MHHISISDEGSPSDSYTILVAEDDEDVRRALVRMIFRLGYHVLSASSGPHALKVSALYHRPIHLLLSDVIMPGMSGPTLAQQIMRERPGIKILYMSAHDQHYLSSHLSDTELRNYLRKPFSAAQLALRVQRLLGPT